MPNIIYEYPTADGQTIRIEAEPTRRGATRGGISKEEVIKKAEMTFEKALSSVQAAAKGLQTVIDQVNPDEATIEFNLKAGGEAGFFSICKAATEAEFKISLTWKNQTPK